MKGKKLLALIVVLITFISVIAPVNLFADELDDINNAQSAAEQQGSELSAEINDALKAVGDKYTEIDQLNAKISDNKDKIATAKQDIATSKEKITKRRAVVSERLRAMQVESSNQNSFAMLFEAKNFSDFVSRAFVLSQLQDAENSKIEALVNEEANLTKLMATLENAQQALTSNEADLQTELSDLSTQATALQTKFSENQSLLQSLATKKPETTEIIAREKAAAEEAAKQKAAADAAAKAQAQKDAAAKQAAASSNANANNSNNTTTGTTPSQPETTTPSVPDTSTDAPTGGKVMYMESTAYSYKEAGASWGTAMGIDLRQNPQVIAVDPSVIPLGSIVYVEGYGQAIAADTGGAIKGNIIDVHLTSVDACYQWGRRQVKVTIIS